MEYHPTGKVLVVYTFRFILTQHVFIKLIFTILVHVRIITLLLHVTGVLRLLKIIGH